MMLFRLLLGFSSGSSLMSTLAALCGLAFIVGDAGAGSPSPAPSGAGGGAPAGAPADGSADPELEIIRDEPPAGDGLEAADEDEEAEEDDSHVSIREHPDYKRIKNDRRNLQRKYTKANRIAEAVRAAGVSVADLISGHRQAREYTEALQRNPALANVLRGGAPADGGARPAPRAPAPATEFDEANFPYDTSTPEGKYFFEQMKSAHATGQRVQQLETMVRNLVAHIGGGEQRTVEQAWKAATEAVAKTIPEKLRIGGAVYRIREAFVDNVKGALNHARATGVRVTPELVQRVISHYRSETPQGGPANRGAAQQRIAEHNRALPRAGQLGGGSPASPRTRETVQQVSARLRRQAAAGG